MLRNLRRRLSYANVMATIAVFVALGGSSYAAITITGRNVPNDALTGADIRDLTGKDVTDGTLRRQDFAPGQVALEGPKGDTGAKGAAGPAGPAGISGLEIQEQESGASSDSSKTIVAHCPAGKKVIGTGADIISGKDPASTFPNELDDVVIDQIQPYNPPSPDVLSQVVVQAMEVDPTPDVWSVKAFAVCASVAE